MPEIRKIVAQAEANGYPMSSFIKGVVNSEAFRMQRVDVTQENPEAAQRR